MKFLLIIGTISIFGIYATANASRVPDHPKVDYIRDPGLFKPESDPELLDSEKKAIKISKNEIEKYYGFEIRGLFSVAKSKSGYQVYFCRIEKKISENKWQEVVEGFGEVFLSLDLKVLYSAIGP